MSIVGSGTDDDRERVLATQRKRWAYLRHLYDRYQDVPAAHAQSLEGFEVAKVIGISDRKEADRVFTHLKDAGLTKFTAMESWDHAGRHRRGGTRARCT